MTKRKKKAARGKKIRARKIRASARSARSPQKAKITEVRIGARVISLEPAPVTTDRKSSQNAKVAFEMSKASMAKNAGQLVDLATGLVKSGAAFGAEIGVQSGIKGRKILKEKAASLATGTTRRVSQVVRKGSKLARKSIKKIKKM